MPENRDNIAAEGTDNGRADSRFAELVLRHRFIANLVIHNVLFAAALLVAYLVWFEAAQAGSPVALSWLPRYLSHLPFFLVAKSIIFGRMKLFRGWWQYASIRDVVSILIASWLFLAVAYVVVLFGVYIPNWLDQKELFDHSNGVLVLEVPANSMAARIGLKAHDVILALDAHETRDVEALRKLHKTAAGRKTYTLTVWRSQAKHVLTVGAGP